MLKHEECPVIRIINRRCVSLLIHCVCDVFAPMCREPPDVRHLSALLH
ncbi:hypothetical protein ACS0PU_008995 [Formica fusca]